MSNIFDPSKRPKIGLGLQSQNFLFGRLGLQFQAFFLGHLGLNVKMFGLFGPKKHFKPQKC